MSDTLPDLQCPSCLRICRDGSQKVHRWAWQPCKERLDVDDSYCPDCQKAADEESHARKATQEAP